ERFGVERRGTAPRVLDLLFQEHDLQGEDMLRVEIACRVRLLDAAGSDPRPATKVDRRPDAQLEIGARENVLVLGLGERWLASRWRHAAPASGAVLPVRPHQVNVDALARALCHRKVARGLDEEPDDTGLHSLVAAVDTRVGLRVTALPHRFGDTHRSRVLRHRSLAHADVAHEAREVLERRIDLRHALRERERDEAGRKYEKASHPSPPGRDTSPTLPGSGQANASASSSYDSSRSWWSATWVVTISSSTCSCSLSSCRRTRTRSGVPYTSMRRECAAIASSSGVNG